jgi:RNA ligase (TIGR02306 family)
VYFEIDSFMPDGVPAWQFLVDKSPRMFNGVKGHKLRTIKLRGQISQGLILKISEFPVLEQILNPTLTLARDIEDPAYNCWFGLHEYEAALSPEDLILNDVLNIVKWDPPLNAQLAGLAEGLFPSWIRKTDQERAQNLKDEIFGYEDTVIPANVELGRPEIIRRAKAERFAQYEITMKMDGSSATFFHRDGEIGVCSRNLQLKVSDANKENSFVRMLFDSGLNYVLPQLGNVAIQGELMGPAIQGNRENLKDFTLFIFDVQLLDEGRNMTSVERLAFVKELGRLGVNVFGKVRHAPVLVRKDGALAWVDHVNDLPTESWFTLEELGLLRMEDLLAFAEGPSLVHAIREGLVYKRKDGMFSMKTISNAYLAKEKD